MKLLLLTLTGLAQFYAFADSAQFDPSQCGINFPKRQPGVIPTVFHRQSYQDEYWPLVCVANGKYNNPGVGIEQTFEFKANGVKNLVQRYYFKKAKVAAGNYGQNLKPGECAWPGRPMGDGEYAVLEDEMIYDNVKFETKTTSDGLGRTSIQTTIRTEWNQIMETNPSFYVYAKLSPMIRAMEIIPMCDVRSMGIWPMQLGQW